MDMTKECILALSPLLRGLTFDGEKGHYVVFTDKISRENTAYTIDIKNADTIASVQEISNLLLNEFGGHEGKKQELPNIVVINGIGSFYLDTSYDNALQRIQGDKIERKHNEDRKNQAQSSRADVVKDKIAVVTGGAQGFGEGLVKELALMGCLVFIADMNFEKAGILAEEINATCKKTQALPVEVNVTSESSIENMIFEITKKAGGIDLFISNAGVLKAASVKEMSLDTFSFVTDVNYIGYFLCVKHAAIVMALQNKPSGKYYSDIIQINSKSGLEGSKKNAAYAGGKFGGIGLTQSFALELIEDNIKVNSICPGNFFEGPLWSDPNNGLFVQYLRTGKVQGAKSIADVKKFYEGKVPMGRGCTASDVIKAVYYLIEQKYETGQAVPVTGGQVMLN